MLKFLDQANGTGIHEQDWRAIPNTFPRGLATFGTAIVRYAVQHGWLQDD
jgi:hypothetical protein